MPTFRPPSSGVVPLANAATPRHQRRPFALMVGHVPIGVNVWKKTDGSYTQTQPLPEDIAVTYHGGHDHSVSATEAAALTAAGYGAYLT